MSIVPTFRSESNLYGTESFCIDSRFIQVWVNLDITGFGFPLDSIDHSLNLAWLDFNLSIDRKLPVSLIGYFQEPFVVLVM